MQVAPRHTLQLRGGTWKSAVYERAGSALSFVIGIAVALGPYVGFRFFIWFDRK